MTLYSLTTIRCDRQLPCKNCVRSHAQCIPAATAPRQRRRRFPERDLLQRLRKYESLLRQHNIEFEPLHKDSLTLENRSRDADGSGHGEVDVEQPAPSPSPDRSSSKEVTGKFETMFKAKYMLCRERSYIRRGTNDVLVGACGMP